MGFMDFGRVATLNNRRLQEGIRKPYGNKKITALPVRQFALGKSRNSRAKMRKKEEMEFLAVLTVCLLIALIGFLWVVY